MDKGPSRSITNTTVDASYFTLRDDEPGEQVVTVEVRPNLLVDTNKDGKILGIETLGHVVDTNDFVLILLRATLTKVS